MPGLTQCAVAFGDYDNDGRVDILIAGMNASSNRLAKIFHNNGNGVFSDSGAVLTGVSQAAVAWGDYDNDGFADAIVAGQGAVTKVYHNNGDGTFTDEHAALPTIVAHSVSWGDFDGDGDLDLLLGSQVYSNNWNTPNSPPTAPTGLQVQLNLPNQVRLGWTPSTDLETTNSAGLNYNLRVGTSPGASQIIAPQSDISTGFHRVPQAGNAGYTNFWRVANLTNGTYYWTVQAIDPGFAASTFAAESSFIVSRPIISALTNRSMPPNSTLGPIPFTVSDAETTASNLVVTAASSNTNLIPASGLVLGGGGTNRTLNITPAIDRSGVATITVFATDENGETAAASFVLTVERFKVVTTISLNPGPMAWGDYDNDGFLDLIFANLICHNSGNLVGLPQFVIATNVSAAVEGSANWGDFDNDGDLDLLVTGSNASRILRNDGTNWANINASLIAPGTFGSSAWGDFNNDGLLDVVIAGGNGARIYRNNGNGSFSDINASLPPVVGKVAVAWGDYDNDGDLDLLVAGSGVLRIYRNNGGVFFDINAGFPVSTIPPSPGVILTTTASSISPPAVPPITPWPASSPASIVVSPMPASSPLPMSPPSPALPPVFVMAWLPGVITITMAASTCSSPVNPPTTSPSLACITTTAALAARSATAVCLSPRCPIRSPSGAISTTMAIFDLGLSGNTNTFGSICVVLRNFGSFSPSNSPPTAPTGLASTIISKSASLRWLAPSDPNQTNGFTYNLRVGTAPGLANIVNPMSASSGQRRIAALGNTDGRLSWSVTNLTAGTYYWSVQAIDNSFAGSPFAAEQTFTITNRPPVVTDRFLATAEDTPGSITLTAFDPDNDALTFSIVTLPAVW